MKLFDKIWEESGLSVIDFDDDYGGCLSKDDVEMIFRATMLAAADIASEGGDIGKGRGLEWRTTIAAEIREAAE